MKGNALSVALALGMATPLVFAFALDEHEVEVVAVSQSEVAVVADESNEVADTVNLTELTGVTVIDDCDPTANSDGLPAMLSYTGAAQFRCMQMPAGNGSQLVAAPATVARFPFLSGHLCLNPFSMMKVSAPTLTGSETIYGADAIGVPGRTWYFQVLYRDPGFGFGSNLSSLTEAVWMPTN